MSRFFYRARNNSNKIVQNYMEAQSMADAAMRLENKGLIVLEITEEPKNSFKHEHRASAADRIILTVREKKEFFNSFYYLYKSGLPVWQIFRSMLQSSKNPKIKCLCLNITQEIEQGKTLREAMKNHAQTLGLAYTMLIAAGDETGKLEENLSGIIKNITKQEEIKSSLISSLTYPVCIFFLAIAVGLLYKFFIIKVFELGAGASFQNISALALGAVIKIALIFAAIFACMFCIYKNKILLNKTWGFFLNNKLFKNILLNYNFLNFFSVLALAFNSGIDAAQSVMLANSVINNREINRKITKAEKMIEQGCNISTALGVTGLFSDYAMSEIHAGEKAGELDKMFKAAAGDYQNRFDNAIKILLKIVEPVMIGIVGIFVAYIAVKGYNAYYNAIFSMF